MSIIFKMMLLQINGRFIQIFLFSNIFLVSCQTISSSNSGSLLFKNLVKSSSDDDFKPMKYFRNERLYYKDSLFIEEKYHIYIHTDPDGNEKWNNEVNKYIFVNLPLRTLYEYQTFSDTARLLKSYSLADTSFKDTTWDYFYMKPSRFGKGTVMLSDTILNGIQYKRIRNDTTYRMKNGTQRNEITIGHARCNIKKVPLNLAGKMSQQLECPVVRIDIIFPNNYIISTQMEVLNSLTREELKVFEAWERNAKRNPIK